MLETLLIYYVINEIVERSHRGPDPSELKTPPRTP